MRTTSSINKRKTPYERKIPLFTNSENISANQNNHIQDAAFFEQTFATQTETVNTEHTKYPRLGDGAADSSLH